MKKIIRLTESDLHKIVKESVKRIIKEGGYVSNDGNGMVGGSWGSHTLAASYNLYNDIDNALYDAGYRKGDPDYDEVDKLLREYDKRGLFKIQVDFEESYDNSVGIDYKSSIENVDEEAIERLRNALKNMHVTNPKIKNVILKGLESGVDRLLNDSSVYESLDIEYPESDD